jgi:hypothetical protein
LGTTQIPGAAGRNNWGGVLPGGKTDGEFELSVGLNGGFLCGLRARLDLL